MRALMVKHWRDPRVLAISDQILISLGTFVVTLVAARSLDTHGFSTLTLTLLISLLMANIHRAAVTQPAEILGAAEGGTAAHARLIHTLSLNHALALASVLLFVALGAVLGLQPTHMLLGWLVFVGFGFQDSLRRFAYSRHDSKTALQITAIAQFTLYSCLVGLRAASWISVESILCVVVLGSLLSSLWGARRFRTGFHWCTTHVAVIWRQHRPAAQWLLLTVAAVWGASQFYMFLGVMLGALAVAYLAACRSLLASSSVVSQAMANYVPSRVALRLRSDGMPGVRQLLYRHMIPTLVVCAGFLLVAVLAAEPLLAWLYGESFAAAAPYMRILAIGYAMSLASVVLGSFCIGLGDSRSGFVSNLVGACFMLTAGLWMTTRHELEGLAWALTISLTLTAATQSLLLARLLRLPHSDAQACKA